MNLPLDIEVQIFDYLKSNDIFNYYQGLSKSISPRVIKVIQKSYDKGGILGSYWYCKCGNKVNNFDGHKSEEEMCKYKLICFCVGCHNHKCATCCIGSEETDCCKICRPQPPSLRESSTWFTSSTSSTSSSTDSDWW